MYICGSNLFGFGVAGAQVPTDGLGGVNLGDSVTFILVSAKVSPARLRVALHTGPPSFGELAIPDNGTCRYWVSQSETRIDSLSAGEPDLTCEYLSPRTTQHICYLCTGLYV